jgi:hypothetical protein
LTAWDTSLIKVIDMKTHIHNGFQIGFHFGKYPASVLALVILSASLAQAQALTQSFGELQTRVRRGERVQVIDITGKKTEGEFDGISGASLWLITNSTRQEFLDTSIHEVRKRRSESRWDGALIGLGIGAAAGLATVKLHCSGASESEDCHSIGMAVILPIVAGGGAGVGGLIDFAIKKHDTVFARTGTSGYRFELSPMLGRQLKGVVLSFSF